MSYLQLMVAYIWENGIANEKLIYNKLYLQWRHEHCLKNDRALWGKREQSHVNRGDGYYCIPKHELRKGGIIRSCNRFNKKRRIGTPKTSSSNIIAKRRKYEWIKLVKNPEKASICAQSAANLSDWMTIRIRFRRAPNVRIRLIPKLGKRQCLGSPCSILFPSSGAVARAGGIVVLHTFVKN